MELPPEIWLKIFSYLHNDHHRFLEPLSLVSKQFLTLTNSLRATLSLPNPSTRFLPSLFFRFNALNSIDLSSFHGDPTSILRQIPRYYPHLHSLNLSGRRNLPLDTFREIGYRMKGLKILTLSGLAFLDDDYLLLVADCFPNLQELDVSKWPHRGRSSVTDAGLSALSLKLKNLNSIDISLNDLVTDIGVIALSINCVFLKRIAMEFCRSVTPEAIGPLLKNRPELEELFISGIASNREVPIIIRDISFEFARCLGTLDLSNLYVSNKSLFSIAKGQFPLKSLSLSSSGGFSIEGLASVLHNHRMIEHLDCRAVDFLTDNDISKLSGFLGELVFVNLSFCPKLTPMAFYYLIRACPLLKKVQMRSINMLEEEDLSMDFAINCQVKSLYLDRNNGLSDRCLKMFVKLCPNLHFLDVSNCPKLSEAAVLHVMKRCSGITHLEINRCTQIKNLDIDFDVPSLEVLRAQEAGVGLNREALAAIGKRCRNLRHLDLAFCHNLSVDGVKELVANCKGLREINLTWCKHLDLDADIVSWMVLIRPSLRKIILPHGFEPSEAQMDFFLRHGCLVYEGDPIFGC